MTHGEIMTALRTVREDRSLSQRAIAKAAGVSNSLVYYWEIGTHAPTLPNLIDWAAALGYSVRIFPAVTEEER